MVGRFLDPRVVVVDTLTYRMSKRKAYSDSDDEDNQVCVDTRIMTVRRCHSMCHVPGGRSSPGDGRRAGWEEAVAV